MKFSPPLNCKPNWLRIRSQYRSKTIERTNNVFIEISWNLRCSVVVLFFLHHILFLIRIFNLCDGFLEKVILNDNVGGFVMFFIGNQWKEDEICLIIVESFFFWWNFGWLWEFLKRLGVCCSLTLVFHTRLQGFVMVEMNIAKRSCQWNDQCLFSVNM